MDHSFSFSITVLDQILHHQTLALYLDQDLLKDQG